MRALGATACAAFALACSGPTPGDSGKDAGGDAQTDGGVDCVDVIKTYEDLPDPAQWTPTLYPIRGWLWSDGTALGISSLAFYGAPLIDQAEPRLSLFVIDETGTTVFEQQHVLFPPGTTGFEATVYSAAAWGGQFIIGLSDISTVPLGDAFAIFDTMSDKPRARLTLPVAGDPQEIISHSFAAWDGEAFAMHAYGVPPTTLFVSRVAADGTVLLPLTRYGRTASGPTTILGHVSSTSPESGRTYVFDASGAGYLSGHLRDGTPLPGTETQAKKVEAVGTPTLSPHLPGVAADAEGAWVGFEQYNGTNIGMPMLVQRLTADGDPGGPAVEVPLFPLDDPGGVRAWDLVSAGANRVTVAAASSFGVYAMDVEDGEVRNVRAVAKFDGKKEDIRDLIALEHAGELWIGFSENSDGAVLRVLKASPGCVYGATR